MDRWRSKKSDHQGAPIVTRTDDPQNGVELVASTTWKTGQDPTAQRGAFDTSSGTLSENEATKWETPTGLLVTHEIRDLDGSGDALLYPNSATSPHLKPPSTGTPLGDPRSSENFTSGPEELIFKQQNSKTGKRKLRLLMNPMSFFLRRRSSQGTASGMEQAAIKDLDYDPRIRGVGVHDFNNRSPQVRRDLRPPPQLNASGNTSDQWSSHMGRNKREAVGHSPKSNSGDATTLFSAGSTDEIANGQSGVRPHYQQYLDLTEKNEPRGPSIEAFRHSLDEPGSQATVSSTDYVPLSLAGGIALKLDQPEPSSDVPERHPSTGSQTCETTGLNGDDPTNYGQLSEHYHIQPENIPRHMNSTASRFSFDLIGVDQEHLLEEKHRRIMGRKAFREPGSAQSSERQPATTGSDTESDDGSAPVSEYSAVSEEPVPLVCLDAATTEGDESYYNNETPKHSQSEHFSASRQVVKTHVDDDMLGQDTSKHGSLFREAEEAVQIFEAITDFRQCADHEKHETDQVHMDKTATEGGVSADSLAIIWPNSPQPVLLEHDTGVPLPKNDLAANYLLGGDLAIRHDALDAATEHPSFNSDFGAVSQSVGPSSNESTYSELPRLEITNSSDVMGKETFDSVEYDNELEEETAADDDPIIAAANAEVLASDSDGFYGQEFGFYANANGSSDSEYALGGFFGSPGNDGLFRSHSGNATFREPNLTPITERSEYSARSSFAFSHLSTATHPAVQPLQNFGLAQLAARMDSSVDDLSLVNLQKLRKNAWGGSNTSLGSADSLGGGSLPRLPALPHSTTGFSMSTSHLSLTGTGDASSCYGSSSDGYRSVPASPTLTQLDPPLNQKDTSESAEPFLHNKEVGSPSTRSEHRTESVRYVKEEDSSGQTRWVVERLRRLESGKVEVLGRELVSGGRI